MEVNMHRYRSIYREHKEKKIPRFVIAQTLGVSHKTVQSWIYRGQLESRYLADVLRFLINNPKYLKKFTKENP